MSDKVVVTSDQLKAKAKCEALKPTRNDLKHLPGYYEREQKVMRTGVGLVDGYTWGVRHNPQDGGSGTKTSKAVQEAMRPFQRADVERHLNNTGSGFVPKFDPMKNPVRLMTGDDGMDFRYVGGAWEPTGWRLVRGERVMIEPVGFQHDPDGNPWEYRDGEWRRA